MYYLLETSITSNSLPLSPTPVSFSISSLAHHNFLLPLSPSTFLTLLLDLFLLLLLSIKTKQKFSLPYFKRESNISPKRNTKILLHCVSSSNIIVKQKVTEVRSCSCSQGMISLASCLDPELNPAKGD